MLPSTATVRRWLLILIVLVWVLPAACRSDSGRGVRIESLAAPAPADPVVRVAPPSVPLRIAMPEGLRDLVAGRAAPSAEDGIPAPLLVPEDADADLRVIVSDRASDDPIVRRWSVVTAAARIDLNGVTLTALEQAARESRLFAAAEHQSLVAPFFAAGGTVTAVPGDMLPGLLAAAPDSYALVPVDQVTVQVRALALDGIDPVRGEGDPTRYPLVTRARVEPVATPAADAVARLTAGLRLVEQTPIRVAFTGDLIPARCVYDQMRRLGDWHAPYQAMGDRLRGADLTVGSLDAAISDTGTAIGCRETYSLLAPPEVVPGLAAAGFDVISVATNHVKDCGASGPCGDATFLDTIARLEAAGISAAGGGREVVEARRPVVMDSGGVRFAFLAYDDIARYYHATPETPGTAPLDAETIAADIAAARARADVVIVLPQWGEEYTPDPTGRQQEIAALAIDAGAAMVVGNHPHVVQAAAPRGEGYVAYALGNFLFDQDWSAETTEGALLEATFHGPRLVAVRFVPYRIENRLQPVPLPDAAAERVLRRMMTAAARLR